MTDTEAKDNEARYLRLTIVSSIILGFVGMWGLPPDLYFRLDRFLDGSPQPYFGFSADRYLQGGEPRSGWTIAGFLIAKFAVGVAVAWLVYAAVRYVRHGAQSKPVDSAAMKPARAKYIKWGFVTAALIGMGIYLVLMADDYRGFRQSTQQFCKVRLTDTRAEVLYKLGRPQSVEEKPQPASEQSKNPFDKFARLYYVDGPSGDMNTMPKDKTLEDFFTWQWSLDKGGQFYTAVTFGKDGIVESILCFDNRSNITAWGPLAGIHDGASEDSIHNLGKPTKSTIDGVTKIIEFDDIGVRFNLVRQRAYSAELRHPTGGEFALLKRFLHTLLP
jgi:hypothetical protein